MTKVVLALFGNCLLWIAGFWSWTLFALKFRSFLPQSQTIFAHNIGHCYSNLGTFRLNLEAISIFVSWAHFALKLGQKCRLWPYCNRASFFNSSHQFKFKKKIIIREVKTSIWRKSEKNYIKEFLMRWLFSIFINFGLNIPISYKSYHNHKMMMKNPKLKKHPQNLKGRNWKSSKKL